MFIALIVFTALVLLAWLIAPFWQRPVAAGAPPAPANEARRQLRDLEFDRATGKVDEDDFAQMKAATEQKLEKSVAVRPEVQPARTEYSREHWASALAEAEIAIACARLRLKSQSAKCAQCGHKLTASDKFCAVCGAARDGKPVAVAESTPTVTKVEAGG